MKIAVYKPINMPCSISNYYTNIKQVLEDTYGCEFVEFNESSEIPNDVSICWDPRGGRGAPPKWLSAIDFPFVGTFHGAVHMALPLRESMGMDPMKWLTGIKERRLTVNGWNIFNNDFTNIITVSNYAKREFVDNMGFAADIVCAIHHGVDHEQFAQNSGGDLTDLYYLHISSYQPKKNIKRIIKAYQSILIENKPRLLIISPGFNKYAHVDGVEIINEVMSHEELVGYYQNAVAFVFPSLHETFGMPILEAMASGCPVITSNNTACKEVASDAALLVDARDVKSIANAMSVMANNSSLRSSYVKSGLRRSLEFTWSDSAKKHFDLFEKIVKKTYNKYFWNRRYKTCMVLGSGPGSRGYAKWYKRNLISDIVQRYNISSIIDIGCGDLEIVSELPNRLLRYLGLDISTEIITINKNKVLARFNSAEFRVHDIVSEPIQTNHFDMVLCFDILIHQLDEANFYNAVENIISTNTTYILLSYQRKPGSVKSELPDNLPQDVIEAENDFRLQDMANTEVERGVVSWFGQLQDVFKEKYPDIVFQKVGEYRGQDVYFIDKTNNHAE